MKLFEITTPSELEEIKKLIKADCGTFLNMVHYQPLYRGITNPTESNSVKMHGAHTLIGKVRKDRKPKDSSRNLHALLDSKFKEYFGVKARSEGLFASFSPETASSYGEKYIIFPMGNDVRIIWSPILSDLYDSFEQSWGYGNSSDIAAKRFREMVREYMTIYHMERGWDSDKEASDFDPEERYEAIEWILDEYHDELFSEEIEPDMHKHYHGHEVSVICDYYYGIELKYFDDLGINEDKFVWDLK